MRALLRILLFFALVSLYSGCSAENGPREGSSGASNRGDYLAMMPRETNMLFYANLEAIRNTPFSEEFVLELDEELQDRKYDRDYREFVEGTGFNPETDVDEVLVGTYGQGGDDQFTGAIVKARFDRDKVESYIRERRSRDYRIESYKKNELYIFDDGEEIALTFVKADLIAIGRPGWVESVIDLHDGTGTNVLENPKMARFIEEVPPEEHIWAVVNMEEFTNKWVQDIQRTGASFKGTQTLENIKSLMFYSDFSEKANLFIKGNFTTQGDAELFVETLVGLKAIAKLMVSDDRDAIDLINDIKVKSEGADVTITTRLDKSAIKKFKEKQAGLFGGRRSKLL